MGDRSAFRLLPYLREHVMKPRRESVPWSELEKAWKDMELGLDLDRQPWLREAWRRGVVNSVAIWPHLEDVGDHLKLTYWKSVPADPEDVAHDSRPDDY